MWCLRVCDSVPSNTALHYTTPHCIAQNALLPYLHRSLKQHNMFSDTPRPRSLALLADVDMCHMHHPSLHCSAITPHPYY